MSDQRFDLLPTRSSAVQVSLALWGAILVLTTGLAFIAGNIASIGELVPQFTGLATALAVSALLYAGLRLAQGQPPVRAYMIVTATVPLLAGLQSALDYGGQYVATQLFGHTRMPSTDPLYLAQTFFPYLVCYALNLGLFWISAVNQRSRDEQNRLFQARVKAAQAEAQAARAELAALHYQLNPHFLLNSLNSVSCLIMDGHYEQADETVVRMSGFLRDVLEMEPNSKVELADELARTERYLDIQRVRFSQKFSTEIHCSEPLAGALVPSLILQPLVENAVKYAVVPSGEPVRLSVRASSEDGELRLTVEDDGPGAVVQEGTGIGLANVRNKLQTYYGDAALCTSEPRERGFRVELRLPLEMPNAANTPGSRISPT